MILRQTVLHSVCYVNISFFLVSKVLLIVTSSAHDTWSLYHTEDLALWQRVPCEQNISHVYIRSSESNDHLANRNTIILLSMVCICIEPIRIDVRFRRGNSGSDLQIDPDTQALWFNSHITFSRSSIPWWCWRGVHIGQGWTHTHYLLVGSP